MAGKVVSYQVDVAGVGLAFSTARSTRKYPSVFREGPVSVRALGHRAPAKRRRPTSFPDLGYTPAVPRDAMAARRPARCRREGARANRAQLI